MKNIYFFVTMFMSFIFFTSCNFGKQDKTDETKHPIDSVMVDSQNVESSWPKNDSIKKLFSTYSLNKLLKIYNYNKGLESSDSSYLVRLAYDAIEDLHEVDSTTYNKYVNDFWKSKTPITKVFYKSDLVNLIGSAKDTDYIEFTFTEDQNNQFSHRVVKQHNFKTKLSCIPAIIFLKMKSDSVFEKLEIVKGIKTFTNPPSKYSGPHLMAILKYLDSNKKIQYFDIVDDPTIDRNGYGN